MGTNTSNYNLKKPSQEDFYNIDDQNANMDIIDTQLKSLKDADENLAGHNHDGKYETPEGVKTEVAAAEAVAKAYTDEKVGSVGGELSSHLSDNVKHITAGERASWNGKQTALTDLDILNKLKNVDGAGSGLDADTVDGISSVGFATAAQGILATNAMPNTYGRINITSVSFTLSPNNVNEVVYTVNTEAIIITIPNSAALPIGTQITFIQDNTGSVTFAPAGGVILNSKDSKRTIDGRWASVTLIKATTVGWWAIGALA